jgi:hypothetical protein
MPPAAAEAMPPAGAGRWPIWCRGISLRRAGRPGLSVPPPGHQCFLIDQRQEHGRADGDPAPVQDLLVKPRDSLAHLALGAQVLHRPGQPFGACVLSCRDPPHQRSPGSAGPPRRR